MSSINSISSFFLIAALVYATATPFADAAWLTNLAVNGSVCCTRTGTCAPGSVGIAAAPATLNCPTMGVVATTRTDAAGNFAFPSTNLADSVSPSQCRVNIALPLRRPAATSCPRLAIGRSLVGPVVITSNSTFSVWGGNVTGTALVFHRNLI